jgi:hypothetical protein
MEVEDWEAFCANYEAYLSETTAVLDQISPDEFMPELTLFDTIVASLRVAPDLELFGE